MSWTPSQRLKDRAAKRDAAAKEVEAARADLTRATDRLAAANDILSQRQALVDELHPTKLSPEGVKFIMQHEGLRLEAYQDVVGVWTIGYGHTGPEVVKGLKITQAKALDYLRQDLTKFERAVSGGLTGVPLYQSMFDALVSFSFNVGTKAFADSTMRKALLAKDYLGAAHQFDLWHKPKEIIGRRNDEKALFMRDLL